MHKCTVIAISGGSGSGKTALASLLVNHFSGDALLISQDSYYKDLSNLTVTERKAVNFDDPSSIDTDLLYEDIRDLKKGLPIKIPAYCFETHTRRDEQKSLTPYSVILLEGLYSFFDKKISKLVDYSIYIDADDDVRLIRRIKRDSIERGRNVESVISQYESTVRRMHFEFVIKQKNIADHVVYNNGNVELIELSRELFAEIKNYIDLTTAHKIKE